MLSSETAQLRALGLCQGTGNSDHAARRGEYCQSRAHPRQGTAGVLVRSCWRAVQKQTMSEQKGQTKDACERERGESAASKASCERDSNSACVFSAHPAFQLNTQSVERQCPRARQPGKQPTGHELIALCELHGCVAI